jgi:hypothetical protein
MSHRATKAKFEAISAGPLACNPHFLGFRFSSREQWISKDHYAIIRLAGTRRK